MFVISKYPQIICIDFGQEISTLAHGTDDSVYAIWITIWIQGFLEDFISNLGGIGTVLCSLSHFVVTLLTIVPFLFTHNICV